MLIAQNGCMLLLSQPKDYSYNTLLRMGYSHSSILKLVQTFGLVFYITGNQLQIQFDDIGLQILFRVFLT